MFISRNIDDSAPFFDIPIISANISPTDGLALLSVQCYKRVWTFDLSSPKRFINQLKI